MKRRPSQPDKMIELLIKLADRLDFSEIGDQRLTAKISPGNRPMAIHAVHQPHLLMIQFTGFGDLLGSEAVLYHNRHNITKGIIGLDGDVVLGYTKLLPKNTTLTVNRDSGPSY